MFIFIIPDTEEDVRRAQEDKAFLEQFIKRHKGFIKRCAVLTMKRFISESDDAWSIALIAFHEAVRSYGEGKGSFKSFAGMVIRRRLIDYIKSEQRFSGEISTNPYTMDGGVEDDANITSLEAAMRERQAAMYREGEVNETSGAGSLIGSGEASPGTSKAKDEIEAVQECLSAYGFSFFDLVECSPKAEKTKKACARAVLALLGEDSGADPMFEKMRTSRNLPMKELSESSGVPRKILERHRKYIIAAAEILKGEYPILQEYLRYILKAGDGKGVS